MLDRATLAAYESGAGTYAGRGHLPAGAPAQSLLERVVRLVDDRGDAAGPILDLGCGTGNDLATLDGLGTDDGPASVNSSPAAEIDNAPPGVIGVDPSAAMLAHATAAHPAAPLVRARAGALPFRPQSLGGAWSAKALQHLEAADLPLALADLHRCLPVGAPISLRLFAGDGREVSGPDNDLPGRLYTRWAPDRLAELATGAGFVDIDVAEKPPADKSRWAYLDLTATRGRTLADTVGADMRLLISGLNPSLHAADAGFGYAGPSNRFWPALVEAGLCPPAALRDPWRLLTAAAIGMTDIVKRATPKAAEVKTAEYRAGIERLDRLCSLVEPDAVVLVGLAGWRAGFDRKATAGWQERRLGPSPVYVMPSTSGLNAATSKADLVAHLRAAADGPTR